MATYRMLWKTTTCLLAIVGCVAALVFITLSVDLTLFAVVMTVGGAIKFTVDTAANQAASVAIRSAARMALGVAAAVMAICGYAAAAGVSAMALVALVAGTSPPVASRLLAAAAPDPVGTLPAGGDSTSAITSAPSPAVTAGPSEPSERPAQMLADLELCRRWRRSYLALERAASVDERLRIVCLRQSYLDELERRAPSQLAEWLHTGARAAGDPTKFICPNPGPSQ